MIAIYYCFYLYFCDWIFGVGPVLIKNYDNFEKFLLYTRDYDFFGFFFPLG